MAQRSERRAFKSGWQQLQPKGDFKAGYWLRLADSFNLPRGVDKHGVTNSILRVISGDSGLEKLGNGSGRQLRRQNQLL
ncbi:hypothetical protein MIR68_007363 [Amoeboaphelidium protococcarum]|nr:hypothetical protein MIR68_007363 [Amoeboaphelidium protococcarum]